MPILLNCWQAFGNLVQCQNKIDYVKWAMSDETEDAKYRVIELLADNPDLTQREMAQRLGLTLGATHYSLKALAKASLVKAERFAVSDMSSRPKLLKHSLRQSIAKPT